MGVCVCVCVCVHDCGPHIVFGGLPFSTQTATLALRTDFAQGREQELDAPHPFLSSFNFQLSWDLQRVVSGVCVFCLFPVNFGGLPFGVRTATLLLRTDFAQGRERS